MTPCEWLWATGAWLFGLARANVAAELIALGLSVLMFYPLGVFWWTGWERRKAEILGSLNANAKRRYLTIFQKGDPNNKKGMTDEVAVANFTKLYLDEYGLHKFYGPFALFFIIAVVQNFVLAKALIALVNNDATIAQFHVAPAAIAGAYTFVCWDLFARMQQRTLSRAGILRSALRLAVAVPIGMAFSTVSKDLELLIAFGVGAFPVQPIGALLQRMVKKFFPAENKANDARDQVFKLTGIDTDIAERIEDADITTITQLAWADPVHLTMRTNLQFAFVLDIVSQALAWVYLEDKLQPIGKVGLRGAVEIRSMLKDIGVIAAGAESEVHLWIIARKFLMGPDGIEPVDVAVEVDASGQPKLPKGKEPDSEAAKAAVMAAAKLIGIEAPALLYALIQVGKDPTAEFLAISWDSLTEER